VGEHLNLTKPGETSKSNFALQKLKPSRQRACYYLFARRNNFSSSFDV